jgi:hypothetical protein
MIRQQPWLRRSGGDHGPAPEVDGRAPPMGVLW